MRRLPPLAAIRVFEAAARHENFTLAATELGMTQAAVSYQVKALEDRIGAALFVRERGRARLSPLGQRLLPALTQAFDAMAAAFAITRQEDEGTLTITTTYTFANTWLAWQLGLFQLQHPELAVRLETGDAIADLAGGDVDLAIRAGDGRWRGLHCDLLLKSDFTPMCSPEFLRTVERELGRQVQTSDLPDQTLIGPQDEWWTIWFRDAGVPYDRSLRRGGIRLDTQANEGRAAMGGQGFALLTPFLWRGDLVSGRLVQPFAQTSTAGYAYWLAIPPERMNIAKIKRFREWLLRQVKEESDAILPPADGLRQRS